LSATQCI